LDNSPLTPSSEKRGKLTTYLADTMSPSPLVKGRMGGVQYMVMGFKFLFLDYFEAETKSQSKFHEVGWELT